MKSNPGDDFLVNGVDILRRWPGVEGKRLSLRDVADRLNRYILEAAIDKSVGQFIEGGRGFRFGHRRVTFRGEGGRLLDQGESG